MIKNIFQSLLHFAKKLYGIGFAQSKKVCEIAQRINLYIIFDLVII